MMPSIFLAQPELSFTLPWTIDHLSFPRFLCQTICAYSIRIMIPTPPGVIQKVSGLIQWDNDNFHLHLMYCTICRFANPRKT